MARLVKKGARAYTNIDNQEVRDSKLTWKARGIFAYLWSQADNWQFYVGEIVKHSPGSLTELRTGLDELKARGYLKIVNRHDKRGKFSGMDWILTDHPLKKVPERPSNHRDAENPSDGFSVRRVSRTTENRTLRNNNNKKYQYKELTNTRSSSSVPPKSDKPTDPFKITIHSKEEEEEFVNNLLGYFYQSVQIASFWPNQEKQIKKKLKAMKPEDARDLMDQVVQSVKKKTIGDPAAYLITSLKNAGD